jgi:hypothetical protein
MPNNLVAVAEFVLQQMDHSPPTEVAHLAHNLYELAQREYATEIADAALEVERAATGLSLKRLVPPLTKLSSAISELTH